MNRILVTLAPERHYRGAVTLAANAEQVTSDCDAAFRRPMVGLSPRAAATDSPAELAALYTSPPGPLWPRRRVAAHTVLEKLNTARPVPTP